MRNFIKNHTPEWWDGWCTIAVFIIVWSIGWIIVDFGDNFNTGFQLGLLFYLVGLLVSKWLTWMDRDLLRIYRELNVLNTKIIDRQREAIALKNETIALKNETIKVQNDHITILQEQGAAR